MSKNSASSRGNSYIRFMDLSAKEENLSFDGCHVLHMDGFNPVRKVFESKPGGVSCRKGRSREFWAKQANENITTLGIRN